MTTVVTKNKPYSIFPDLPRDVPLIDENRMLTDPWRFFFDQLVLALQTNFKPEGFVIPPETAANIALLTKAASNNNIVFDSTNGVFKGNINGTWYDFAMASSANVFVLLGP